MPFVVVRVSIYAFAVIQLATRQVLVLLLLLLVFLLLTMRPPLSREASWPASGGN